MANKKFQVPVNLVNLASDPVSASEGDIYYNTTSDQVKVYANGSWVAVGSGGTTSDSFKTISVSGQSDVVADSSTDTLTLIAGTNVSIATNATADSITINSTGNYTSVDSITYPDYITFDTTPETVPTATGSLYWDSGDGLPATVLNANVTIGLGQEQVALVKNATGASIAKGKVVYINGAAGQRPTITLSDADTEATSSKTFGLTAEAIADEAEGFVTTFGVLRGVNTLGLTEGAALWLSSTAGGYTTTVPAEPAHSVFIGYVVKAHATAGEIFVNIQNGYELTELHGVVIEETLADNEVLAYDLSSGLWKNQTSVEAGLIDTSATGQTKAGNLTVSGIGSFNNATVTSGAASSSTTTGALKVDGGVGVTGNIYAGGNLVITGDLTVSGDTTTLNTATLNVEDNLITLNSGVSGSPTLSAGIEVNRGTSTDVSLNWNETSDKWTATYDLNGNKEFGINEVSTLQVVNNNGSTINPLDPVFVSSVNVIDGTVYIQKMSNNTEKFLGFTTSSVADQTKCIVVTRGLITGVNTSSYSAGDILYLSATGTITTTKPSSTYIQKIGEVLFSNASGSIYLFNDETLLPKLTSSYIWVGNGSNEVVETLLNTTNVPEGTALYFTDERAQDAIGNSLGTGLSYNDSTGAISNSGVTGLTGTTNEIVVSGSTGSVTIGIPDSPVFVTPNIGVATATSVNGTTIPSSKTLVVTTDIGSTVQAYDADLASIAALTANGILRKTAGTWGMDSSTYLTSYTETDPIFVAHAAYGITSTNITNWNTAYTDRNKWDGGATGLTASTGRTSLGATTVGSNLFTLANPSAVTFPKINADNTVTAEVASAHRTSLGLGSMALETAANYALLSGATFTGNISVTSVNNTTIPSSKTLVVTTDIGSSVQAYSSTLAGINTLGSGTGFLKNTAGTWSYDNSTYLTTGSASSTYAALAGASFTGAISSTGNISAGGVLKSTASATNEGGQIELSLPSSGSTLSGTNVTIDVFQDKLRIFESGGTNRGVYIPLTSAGATVGTSLLGGTTGAMNYAQTAATKQSGVSSAGTTLVSVSITTNGYPVQVIATGDMENNSAGGWVTLQLYRGSTAVGNIVHAESSAGSENVPFALNAIDAPAAGTYTYALKMNTSAGGTFNFGESNGPVITVVELSGPKGDTGATGAAGSSSNSFSTISVSGQSDVVADSSTDTLTLTAGTGITLTTNATTDAITIGVTGSTYQPLDADLTALAGLTSAANALPYFTGSGTASTTTLSSFGRSLIDDADAAAAITTLGLGTMATQTAANYALLAGATFTGNIAVNNGTSTQITTTGTTAKIFNANATTVEVGHAATTLSLGDIGHSGTTTINNNLAVYGSITFSQGASSLSATTIQIDDTLISLADSNTADILDIGFYAGYRQSSTDYHTGLVRDASDSGKWKLFAGVTAQPTGTVDFTSATYGTLKIGVLEVDSGTLTTTQSNLGLAIGTHVQAYSATLAGINTLGSGTGFLKNTAGTWSYDNSSYQPLDADLTAIAALTANGILRKTAGTWAMDTATYLTSAVTSVATGSGLSGGTITSTGTISLATAYGDTVNPYASKTANYVLASPTGTAGVPSFRALLAADIPTLNQNTTGSAATLTTPRAIYGNNFDGSAALTQVISATYGGTGNGFTAFTGPTTSTKTFTLPNNNATILTDFTDVTLAQGGTNASLTASNGGIVYSDASAMAILAGTATAGKHLQSGSSSAPSWTTATFPSTATSTGTFLRADGTNWVASSQTLTLSGNTTIGSSTHTVAFATSANTSVTLPSSGTLAILGNNTFTGSQTLRAGTATAGTAPLYFTSGTNLTTAAAGAMEFDGTNLYFSPSTTRRTFAFLDTATFTGTVTIPTLSLSTADTATAASHYFIETASDGFVRPKTLANVRTEVVTTAAVNSAAATALGTLTDLNIDTVNIDTFSTSAFTNANGTTIQNVAAETVSYRTAEYIVQCTDTTGAKYRSSKIMVLLTSATTAEITEYAILESSAGELPITFTATAATSLVTLKGQFASAPTNTVTVKVMRIGMT